MLFILGKMYIKRSETMTTPKLEPIEQDKFFFRLIFPFPAERLWVWSMAAAHTEQQRVYFRENHRDWGAHTLFSSLFVCSRDAFWGKEFAPRTSSRLIPGELAQNKSNISGFIFSMNKKFKSPGDHANTAHFVFWHQMFEKFLRTFIYLIKFPFKGCIFSSFNGN